VGFHHYKSSENCLNNPDASFITQNVAGIYSAFGFINFKQNLLHKRSIIIFRIKNLKHA
jgi:hypothetical protein